MTEEQKRELDAQVTAAFAEGSPERGKTWDKDEANARSAQAARKVYDLTRALGLERQRMADAPVWKAPAGIAINAFARRAAAGLLGEGLPGYPFAGFAGSFVRDAKPKRARKPALTCCPNCGHSLKEAA